MRWTQDQPYLAGLLNELSAHPITLEQWQAAGGIAWQTLEWPEDEAQRAKLCLEICRAGNPRHWVDNISTADREADMFREFVEIFVDPLLNFLHDRPTSGARSGSTSGMFTSGIWPTPHEARPMSTPTYVIALRRS